MTAITRVTLDQFSSFFSFPGVIFQGDCPALFFIVLRKILLRSSTFFLLSSSLTKDTHRKNKVSAHAAAAKYNLWRPTDTKIHHDLELSCSPHTAINREHECRTVVGSINTKGPQRQ